MRGAVLVSWLAICACARGRATGARAAGQQQRPVSVPQFIGATIESPLHPRIDYTALSPDYADGGWGGDGDAVEAGTEQRPEGMVLYPLHVSGPSAERVDLMFLSDGYTHDEADKFLADAQRLTGDIVSPSSAMGHVRGLLNVWAAFVPSNTSGVGTQDTPIPGAAFGLYRPGPELRGVYVARPQRARAACRSFREGSGQGREGGCDQAIILGNDPLYGGLGGEFTVITASEKNGPLVLRHELGHSLIPVGEEYEGGFAYFGANSDKVEHVDHLKWKDFLSVGEDVRIEDVKVPIQAYPWYDLSHGPYNITFISSSVSPSHDPLASHDYPSALLRLSLSSIPDPSHINIALNDVPLNLSDAFAPSWAGSKDRRWLGIPLPRGLPKGVNSIDVRLTQEGQDAEEGQGGKMITSLEIEEYGGHGRFNATPGFIGAFPTYAMNGKTNDACLMRNVNYPSFCAVCAHALEESLLGKIEAKREVAADVNAGWQVQVSTK